MIGNYYFSGWRAALQMLVGAVLPSLVYSNKEEENSVHPLSKAGEKFYREFAYFHVQSVMPDSYGYGMVDSPVGLLGWIGNRGDSYTTIQSYRTLTTYFEF